MIFKNLFCYYKTVPKRWDFICDKSTSLYCLSVCVWVFLSLQQRPVLNLLCFDWGRGQRGTERNTLGRNHQWHFLWVILRDNPALAWLWHTHTHTRFRQSICYLVGHLFCGNKELQAGNVFLSGNEFTETPKMLPGTSVLDEVVEFLYICLCCCTCTFPCVCTERVSWWAWWHCPIALSRCLCPDALTCSHSFTNENIQH